MYTCCLVASLQIKVCLPNRQVLNGLVQYYSTKSGLLLVTTKPFPHLRAVRIRNGTQVEPSSDLFAVSCCYETGKLSVTSGTLAGSPSELEGEGITRSTCQITAVRCRFPGLVIFLVLSLEA